MSEGMAVEKKESGSGAIERAKQWMKNHEKSLILTVGLVVGGAGGVAHERQSIQNDTEAIRELLAKNPELQGLEFSNESYKEGPGGDVEIESNVEVAGKALRVRVLINDGFKALQINEPIEDAYSEFQSGVIAKFPNEEKATFRRDDKNGTIDALLP